MKVLKMLNTIRIIFVKDIREFKVCLSLTCCQTMVYIGENISFETTNERLLTTPMIFGSQSPNGETLEWRLAGGKPFAVILRISEDLSLIDPNRKKGIQTALNILSLKGYEKIKADVDVRKYKNANEIVRRKADAGYKKLE